MPSGENLPEAVVHYGNMAAELKYGFVLSATAKTVFEMLVNPDFLTKKIELAQSGNFEITGQSPELTIDVTRTVNADLPAMVRKFVGENLVVQEIQNWKELSAKNYQADFVLKIPNAPVEIKGKIELIELVKTQVEITATVKVNLPIFGATAEPHVVETIKKVLADEEKLCKLWLQTNC